MSKQKSVLTIDYKSELNFQNYHFGWEDTINIAWGYCQYQFYQKKNYGGGSRDDGRV